MPISYLHMFSDSNFEHCLCNVSLETALGLQWHVNEEEFKFRVSALEWPQTWKGVLAICSPYSALLFEPTMCVYFEEITGDKCSATGFKQKEVGKLK